jgi:hypothetical protein
VWTGCSRDVAEIAPEEIDVVGGRLIVNVVPLVTETTVALLASPFPESNMPLSSLAVLAQVTVKLPLVATQEVKLTGAGPPPTTKSAYPFDKPHVRTESHCALVVSFTDM